jgi:hypothetical protein
MNEDDENQKIEQEGEEDTDPFNINEESLKLEELELSVEQLAVKIEKE